MTEREEILGGEEPDEQVDVSGEQEPVDWSQEPFSDAELDKEVQQRLRPALRP